MENSVSNSRRELLQIIDKQKEDLEKYENKLRDVVRAYKGLVKEKEALEASLRNDGEGGEDSLKTALATVTEEKAKLQRNFQDDKKKYTKEKEDLEKQVQALKSELVDVKESTKLRTEDLKSKLIVERHEREKETSDHALQLRELQKLLSEERAAKEKFESQLHDVRLLQKEVAPKSVNVSEYESKIKLLDERLSLKTQEAERAEAKKRKAKEEVARLKAEIDDLRSDHRTQLADAERRASEAQDRATKVREQQEKRVIHLEARLQDLSEAVGTYDRLRQDDQATIQKLKDRITAMEDQKESARPERKKTEPEMNVQSLTDEFMRIKKQLIELNKSSETPIDFSKLFTDDERSAKLQRDLEKIQDDFERYKTSSSRQSIRANQSPLKLLDRRNAESDEQIHSLKSQVSDLTERMSSMQRQMELYDKESQRMKGEEKSLTDALTLARNKLKEQETEFRNRIVQLESEIQKQRDRCMTLIDEKEDEIKMLKNNMDMAFESAFSDQETKLRVAAAKMIQEQQKPKSPKGLENLTDDLKFTSQSEGMVLHYVQELAHKDVQISSLMSKQHDLEAAMRELQFTAVAKEEKYLDKIEGLEDRVLRLQRMTTKEGANLEYLKNVVLNYMLSSDVALREHMLKAIGTVLMFSKEEVARVREHNASWWPARQPTNKR